MTALQRLSDTIAARRTADPDGSWTAKLLATGPEKCAEKFGEESIEAIIEAVRGDRQRLTSEAADVLYHLLVMLAARDLTLADVEAELARREGVSGITEKAARKQPGRILSDANPFPLTTFRGYKRPNRRECDKWRHQNTAEDGMSNDSDNGTHHEGDVAFIQSLAELLNASELSEISVKREYGEHDRLTVSLSKHGKQVTYASAPAAAPHPASAASSTPAPAGVSEDPASLPGAVTSPMVGTAYLSPEPGAAAFVQIGQSVAEGETLMIVEAMKTMNHIPSPRAGTVKRILVDDGSPVEFGAPLMVVE